MAQTLKTSFTIRRLPEDAVTYTLVLPCASLKSNGSDGITADSLQVQVNKSAGSTLTAIATLTALTEEGLSVWYTTGTAYTQLTSSGLTLDTSSLSFSNGYLTFALVSGTSEYSSDNIIDTKTLYIVYDGTDGNSGSSFQWNLLTGTKDFDGWTTYTTDVVSVNTDDDGFGVAYFAAVDTLAWYNIFSSRIALSLVDGQECTLSVWYKADDPDTINNNSTHGIALSLNLASSSSGSREIYVSPYTYSGFTGEWQQLTYTFTPSADLFSEGSGDYSDQAYFWVSLYNYSLSAVSFKKVKLEYGDTATEWTPHPDDLYGTDGNDGNDGADGEDAIVADLSNELSAVPCDSEGNVPSTYEYEESVLSVYKGTTDITDSCVVSTYASGITASYSNRVISVSDITEDEAYVLISVSYGTWSADLYYRIKKIYAGADGEDGGIATVYSLVITPSSVIVDADGNYSVDSLEVAVKKVDVDGVTLLTDADDIEAEGLTIKGYSDGVWGAVSGYDIGLYLLFLEDNQVIYGLFDSSGNIVDKESVPFITSGSDGADGQDGADGTSTGFTITPASLSVNVTWTSSTDSDGNTTFSEDCSGADGTIVVYDKDGNTMTCGSTENGGFVVAKDDDNCVNCTISAFSASTGAFIVTPEKADNGYYKTSGAASFTITIYYGGETYLFRHNMPFTLEESGKTAIFVTNIDGLYSYYSSVNSSIDTLTTNYSSLSQTAEEISSTVSSLTAIYDDDGNITGTVTNIYSQITQTANSISLSVVSSTNETLATLTDIYGDDGSTEGSVTNIQETLTTTGIDILNRTITLTTDNFIVNNNSGDQTLAIDEDGNLLSTQYEDSAETGHIAFGQDGIIVYGGTSSSYNGMIKISVINGTPTLIGVDSNGETVWSLGANSTMSGDISVKFASGVFQTASQSYAFGSGTGYCAYFKATYEVTNNTTSTITIADGGTYSLVAIVPNPWGLDTYLQLPIIADYSIAAGALAVITLECTFCSSESFDGNGLPDYSTIYGVLVSGSTYTLKAESVIYRSDVEDADTGTKTWLGADSADDAVSPTDSSYLIDDLPF